MGDLEPHKIYPYSTTWTSLRAGVRPSRSWKFTDRRKGLRYEALVGGADLIMDILSKPFDHGEDGFALEFSGKPFPGYQHKATRVATVVKQWSGAAGHSGLLDAGVAQGDGFTGWLGHMPAASVPLSGEPVGATQPEPERATIEYAPDWWNDDWGRYHDQRPQSGPASRPAFETGNTYQFTLPDGGTMDGWLCPALFKYFNAAPEHLYIRASPLTTVQQLTVHLAA